MITQIYEPHIRRRRNLGVWYSRIVYKEEIAPNVDVTRHIYIYGTSAEEVQDKVIAELKKLRA